MAHVVHSDEEGGKNQGYNASETDDDTVLTSRMESEDVNANVAAANGTGMGHNGDTQKQQQREEQQQPAGGAHHSHHRYTKFTMSRNKRTESFETLSTETSDTMRSYYPGVDVNLTSVSTFPNDHSSIVREILGNAKIFAGDLSENIGFASDEEDQCFSFVPREESDSDDSHRSGEKTKPSGSGQNDTTADSGRDYNAAIPRPAPVTSSVGGTWRSKQRRGHHVTIQRPPSDDDDTENAEPLTNVGRGQSHLATLVRNFALAHANALVASTPAFSASATDSTSYSSFETYEYYPPPLEQVHNATHWPSVDRKSFNDYISRLRSVRAREELPSSFETCLRTIVSASAVANSDEVVNFLYSHSSVARQIFGKRSASALMADDHFTSDTDLGEDDTEIPMWLERKLEATKYTFSAHQMTDISHFHAVVMGWWPQMRAVSDAYRILSLYESNNRDTNHQDSLEQQSKLKEIPEVFFEPEFDLKKPKYFYALCSECDSASIKSSSSLTSKRIEDLAFDSEKFGILSKHLDVIESDLSNRVRSRKDTLFHALSMLQVLQRKLAETCSAVAQLKEKVHHTKVEKAERMLCILHRRRRSERMKRYRDLLKNVKEILNLKLDVRTKYSSGNYKGALHTLAHISRCLRNVAGSQKKAAVQQPQLSAFPGLIRNNEKLRQSVGNTLVKRFTRSATRLVSAGANSEEVSDMIEKLNLSETQAQAVYSFLRGWSRTNSSAEANFMRLQSVASGSEVRDSLALTGSEKNDESSVSDDACVEAVLHFGILPLIDALLLADVHTLVDNWSIRTSQSADVPERGSSLSILQTAIEGFRSKVTKEIRTVMKLEVGECVKMLQSSSLNDMEEIEDDEEEDREGDNDDIEIGGSIGVKRAELRALSVKDFHKVFDVVCQAFVGLLRRVAALHACICHNISVFEAQLKNTAQSPENDRKNLASTTQLDMDKLHNATLSDAATAFSSVQNLLRRIPAVSFGVLVSACDCVTRQLCKLLSVRKSVHRELAVDKFASFLKSTHTLSTSIHTVIQRASGKQPGRSLGTGGDTSGSSAFAGLESLFDTIVNQMLSSVENLHDSYRESLKAYLDQETWTEATVPENCQRSLFEIAYLSVCPSMSLRARTAAIEFVEKSNVTDSENPKVMKAEKEYSEDCVQLKFKILNETQSVEENEDSLIADGTESQRGGNLVHFGAEGLGLKCVTDQHKLLLMPTVGESSNGNHTNDDAGTDMKTYCKCKRFRIVNSGAALIRMIFEYVEAAQLVCQFEDIHPQSKTPVQGANSKSIVLMVAQLLRDFHEQIDSLILGAGAVSKGILRTITAKHLALTLQTLSTVASFIPLLRSAMTKCLPPVEHAKLQQLWVISKDYSDHIDRLLSKFASIVQDLITSCDSGGLASLASIDWNRLGDNEEFDEAYLAIAGDEALTRRTTEIPQQPDMTSTTAKFLKQIKKLHRILAPILSQPQSEDVFGRIAVTLSAQIPVTCVSFELSNLSEPSTSARIRRFKLCKRRENDNSTVTFDPETEELLNRNDQDEFGLSTAGRARLAWDLLLLIKSLGSLPGFNSGDCENDMTTSTVAMDSLVAWMKRQFGVYVTLDQILPQ